MTKIRLRDVGHIQKHIFSPPASQTVRLHVEKSSAFSLFSYSNAKASLRWPTGFCRPPFFRAENPLSVEIRVS